MACDNTMLLYLQWAVNIIPLACGWDKCRFTWSWRKNPRTM